MSENEILASLDAMIAEHKTEGVGGSLLAHLVELKDAWVSKDPKTIWLAVRGLVDHVMGNEGVVAANQMEALPWLTIVSAVLEFIKLLKK